MPLNNAQEREIQIRALRNIDERVDSILASRWSSRCFSGDPMPEKDLHTIIDGARQAPSAFNAQPWYVIYAHRETEEWEPMFDLLINWNKKWVQNTGVLGLFVSKNKSESGKPQITSSFDTGAFWMSLALQANSMGYNAHGMSGFDFNKAYEVYSIPREDFKVEAMFAIGTIGSYNDLAEEFKEGEKPSQRKSVEEILVHAKRAKETFRPS